MYLYEYTLESQIDYMETSNPTRFVTRRVLVDYNMEFVSNTINSCLLRKIEGD
jgi:uncharacterized protein YfaT (DUF1175 family)